MIRAYCFDVNEAPVRDIDRVICELGWRRLVLDADRGISFEKEGEPSAEGTALEGSRTGLKP